MWIWAPQLFQPWNHLETFENENSTIASKQEWEEKKVDDDLNMLNEQEKMTILFEGEDVCVCGGINLVIIWTSFIAQSM